MLDLAEPALAWCRVGAGQHSLRAAPGQVGCLQPRDLIFKFQGHCPQQRTPSQWQTPEYLLIPSTCSSLGCFLQQVTLQGRLTRTKALELILGLMLSYHSWN